MFAQTVENEDVTSSAVARFDPLRNEWEELGGFGEQRKRFAVVNTDYGVFIVDGEQANLKLCQINDTSIDCEDMENNDLDLIVSVEEVILFTFDHTQCPKSVILTPLAMLFLSTASSRKEFKKFEKLLIFSNGLKKKQKLNSSKQHTTNDWHGWPIVDWI